MPDQRLRFLIRETQTQSKKLKAVTAVVLRGHLIIERLLCGLITGMVPNPERLRLERMPFSQKLALARALTPVEAGSRCWVLVEELNRLRNMLAHSLTHPQFESRLRQIRKQFQTVIKRSDWAMSARGRGELAAVTQIVFALIHFLAPLDGAVWEVADAMQMELKKVAANRAWEGMVPRGEWL